MKELSPAMVILPALTLVPFGCGGAGEAEKHYDSGVHLLEQGSLEEALAEFDQAIPLKPRYSPKIGTPVSTATDAVIA